MFWTIGEFEFEYFGGSDVANKLQIYLAQTNNIHHFVTGIDRVIIRSIEGIRIASTTSIQTLMKSDFDLVINDFAHRVQPPPFEVGAGLNTPLDEKDGRRLGDVRALVGELYEVCSMYYNFDA